MRRLSSCSHVIVASLIALVALGTATTARAVEGVPALGPVFLILGENTELSQLNATDTPYLINTLKPRSAWFTRYYGMGRMSEMNYVSLVSGHYRQCNTRDADPIVCHNDDPNLFSQVDAAGKTWTEWEESMPSDCFRGKGQGAASSQNRYTWIHNPAVFFGSVVGPAGSWVQTQTSAACATHIRAAGSTTGLDTSILEAALAAGRVSDLNVIIPNTCEQGHDQCDQAVAVRQYDNFLARIVPKIEASPAFGPSSIVIATWDEGSTKSFPTRNPYAIFGGKVGLAIDGPGVAAGTYDATHQHYDLLRTLEDALGLGGYLENAATAAPLDEAFTASAANPPNTALTTVPIGATTSSSATFGFETNRAGSTFQCKVDAGAFAACTSSFTATGLTAGSHTFQVRAVNGSGPDPTPATETWTVGSTLPLPETTITSLPIGSTTAVDTGTFTFASDQGKATFECSLDGAAFAGCSSPKDITTLANGSHTFQVRAKNATGADPTPASESWTVVDPPLPETYLTSPPISTTVSTSANFTFTSDSGGTSFTCSMDGAAFTACSSSLSAFYSGLAQGAHTFRVRAQTTLGVDPTPSAETFSVGSGGGAPDTTITTAPIGSTTVPVAYFTFAANRPGATFTCSLDNAAFTTCKTVVLSTGLAGGTHTFRVRATTSNGTDATPATETWTVGSGGPVAPDTAITSTPIGSTTATTASFTFSADQAGSTFECSLDSAAFAACTSPAAYGGLAVGSHTFAVRASVNGLTDASPASETWTISAGGPTQLLNDGFESGTTANWVVTTAVDGTAAVQSTVVRSGSFALRLAASATTGSLAYARRSLGGARTQVTTSGDFMVQTEGASSSNVPLFRLFDASGSRVIGVFRQNLASDKVYVGYGGVNFLTTGKAPLGTWVHVDMRIVATGAATGTVEVKLNGVVVYTTSTAVLPATGVTTAEIGNDVKNQAHATYVDNVVLTTP